ncbi:MAG: c-type cytochrome [Chloroflexota bacterium]
MRYRTLLFLAALALALAACNFTLAEDITPPPNYVSPTAPPTLGPLFPAQPPDVQNGAVIYGEKCLACHGAAGMGDGEQGKQLPVTVAALGLPELARAADPSAWYIIVTQGNIEKFMPPFSSLTEQERWDVVAYALTLHTDPGESVQGAALFETYCTKCHQTSEFGDQAKMAALSELSLFDTITTGKGEKMPAFDNLLEDERWALAAYLRSLTFAASTPTPEPVAATETPVPAEATPTAESAATPSAEGTPVEGTPQAEVPTETPALGIGPVRGTVVLAGGGTIPSDLTVTLRGFDHASDASGPQETLNQTMEVASDGSFLFEGIDLPDGRILLAEMDYGGIVYQTELVVLTEGMTEVTLPELIIYEPSTDLSALTVVQGHAFIEIADGVIQVIEFLSLENPTQTSIIVPVTADAMAIAPVPQGMTSLGFDAQQGQAQPVAAGSDAFGLPPSDLQYGVVAGYEMPYDKKAELSLPFVLDVPSGSLLVPPGVKVSGDGLVDAGQQDIGNGTIYQVYEFGGVQAGGTLDFTVSGQPKTSTTSGGTDASQKNLLIGVGAFGAVLILAGVWMFFRDRGREEVEEEAGEDGVEYEDTESILDAIIALDDLHRAGKIPDEIYQQRRADLKARLKQQ